MSQPEFAYVQGLILGLLTVWGLVWLTSDGRNPPKCNVCGRTCKPISWFPLNPDGRTAYPKNARWFCRGKIGYSHHPSFYPDPAMEEPGEL